MASRGDVSAGSDDRRRLLRALGAVVAVNAVGTLGYALLGLSPLDALYQAVTTVTTVGFRELKPFGAAGKIFTVVLILGGTGTVLYAFTVVLGVVLEGTLGELVGRHRMDHTIDRLTGHVIVCGWGRVGQAIAQHLHGRTVVVVDIEPNRLEGLRVLHVVGDATQEQTLRRAGLDRASAIVAALTTDAENVFVALTARSMHPEVFIVARARDVGSANKLQLAGADRIVNPQELGGARMAAFVEQPHVAAFVDVVTHDRSLEFQLEEVVLSERSPLVGTTLGRAQVRARTGALVLAVRDQDGQFITNPSSDLVLARDQVLIAIGTPEQLASLCTMAGVDQAG